MRKKELEWNNWISVMDLAEIKKLTKRRIQQLLQRMIVEGKVSTIVGVFNSDTTAPFARPLYRRIK